MTKWWPLLGVGLMFGASACGIASHPSAQSVTPHAYHVVISESLPSSPKPITVTWAGTLNRTATQWTSLTEQVGKSPAMTVVPMPKPVRVPKASTTSTTPGKATKAPVTSTKASKGAKAPAVSTKAKGTQTPAKAPPKAGPVVNPVSQVPAQLMQEVQVLMGKHTALPLNLMPLIIAPTSQALTAQVTTASWSHQWTTQVALGSTKVPATVHATAVVAKPQGVVTTIQWTLVESTQYHEVQPTHGKPYGIPALTWTMTGHVTPLSK